MADREPVDSLLAWGLSKDPASLTRQLADALDAALRAKEEAERSCEQLAMAQTITAMGKRAAEARGRELECIVDEYLAPDSEWAFGELEARVRAWKEATGA